MSLQPNLVHIPKAVVRSKVSQNVLMRLKEKGQQKTTTKRDKTAQPRKSEKLSDPHIKGDRKHFVEHLSCDAEMHNFK